MLKKYRNLARKKLYQRTDKKVDENVVFLKQVSVNPWDRLARNVWDQFDDLETVEYNNDILILVIWPKKRKSGKQIAAKKIVRKY